MNYDKFPTFQIGPFQLDWMKGLDQPPDSGVGVLYSPSTHRIICPVNVYLTGTVQLNDTFRAERIIYAAPLEMKDMSDLWSNQDIDDWEERDIRLWTDLAISGG